MFATALQGRKHAQSVTSAETAKVKEAEKYQKLQNKPEPA
jgi:hypothetical protein